MLEDVKESIIDRIDKLIPEASAATLKVLAVTLDITNKIGKETPDEKYFESLMEVFRASKEQAESINEKLSSLKGLSLVDIAKIMGEKK